MIKLEPFKQVDEQCRIYRAELQRIYVDPKEPMEQLFVDKVLAGGSMPMDWDDPMIMAATHAYTFFKMGWDSKKF